MKAYWMILAVFFLCTGFGTSWNNFQSDNYRGLASEQDDSTQIQSLETTICDQNKKISNLETRIEKLIAQSEATLAAAAKEESKAKKDKKDKEAKKENAIAQYTYNGQGYGNNPEVSMALLMLVQQQASQMTLFHSTMAQIQTTQTAILASQGTMFDRMSEAFNQPLYNYSSYPTIYNFGNSKLNNGLSSPSTTNTQVLRQSQLNQLSLDRNFMFNFAPAPILPKAVTPKSSLPEIIQV